MIIGRNLSDTSAGMWIDSLPHTSLLFSATAWTLQVSEGVVTVVSAIRFSATKLAASRREQS